MELPRDWDRPTEENEALCSQFSYHTLSHGGMSLPYRLFQAGTDAPVPLVVYLHGADAVGDDNQLPLSIHEIGTMFAREEWQKDHPCHILAPQYGHGQYWSVEWIKTAVHVLIAQAVRKLGADSSRVYLYGYSAGGVGTLRFLKEHPGVYAGAISICGATDKAGLDHLTRVPLWLVHAADDEIVKASYRSGNTARFQHLGSRDLYDTLRGKAPLLQYTEYPAGYMQEHYGVNPHCSWVCVSDQGNTEFREWLFEQQCDGHR